MVKSVLNRNNKMYFSSNCSIRITLDKTRRTHILLYKIYTCAPMLTDCPAIIRALSKPSVYRCNACAVVFFGLLAREPIAAVAERQFTATKLRGGADYHRTIQTTITIIITTITVIIESVIRIEKYFPRNLTRVHTTTRDTTGSSGTEVVIWSTRKTERNNTVMGYLSNEGRARGVHLL